VERNIPALPKAPSLDLNAPALPGSINDDRALGAKLSTLIVLAPKAQTFSTPRPPGLETDQIARLNHHHARRVLKRFLGRPITRKLISQIEAAIVTEYRRQGYPFVDVSTPEQEITQGVLQIRVVEFHAGRIFISARDAQLVRAAIRQKTGQPIDADALSEDLDWLNRFPYRVVQPTFRAGASLGDADLSLDVVPQKPWSLTAGYANSGSPATGEDRYFLGGTLSGHVLTDILVSAQITGSPDFWAPEARPFDFDTHPQYESAAGRILIATAPRQALELTFDAVETNEPSQVLIIRQDTLEMAAAYRSALSNLSTRLTGEISGGLEISRQLRTSFYGDTPVVKGSANVYQLFAGWADHWSDGVGSTSLDVSVHVSPGRLDAYDSAADYLSFSNGRVASAHYVYGAFALTRALTLPWGFSLSSQANGQYAGQPIPSSQQLILGGQSAVRGYTLDDGALDDGLILRNDLHAPPVALIAKGPFPITLAPRLFADLGYGRDEYLHTDAHLASIGLGADLQLTPHAQLSFDAARALASAKVTQIGDARLDVRLNLAF